MDLNKLYELQDYIRKNAISKKDNLKIVEDERGKNSKVPGEPANVLTRITPQRGDKKIVFYQKSPGVIVARLYNVIDSAEPFDLKPEVSRALRTVFEAAANCTPKQYKDLIESNLKDMANNPTLNMAIDAFYEAIIAEPKRAYRAQQFQIGEKVVGAMRNGSRVPQSVIQAAQPQKGK